MDTFRAVEVLSFVEKFSGKSILDSFIWRNFLELVVLCISNTPNSILKVHFTSINFRQLAKETRNRESLPTRNIIYVLHFIRRQHAFPG